MGKLYQPVNSHGHLRKEVKLPFGHTLIRRRFNQIKWLKKNNYKKEIPLDRRTGNRWPYAATSILENFVVLQTPIGRDIQKLTFLK